MLAGKNAIITGCNRGIGKAILEVFAKSGADIWACVRNQTVEFDNYCKHLEQVHGIEIIPLPFDMTDQAAMKEAFLTIKRSKKTADILVNNAGIVYSGLFQMTDMEIMNQVNQVNLLAGMQLTQYVLKIMLRQKSGSIINIASSGGLDCNPGRSAYNASKAAVIALTKTLAKEVGAQGIRVNAVAPGLTKTDMALNNTPQDLMEKEIAGSALQRIGEPEEIANVIEFLASDRASFVTGQVWRVDGGM